MRMHRQCGVSFPCVVHLDASNYEGLSLKGRTRNGHCNISATEVTLMGLKKTNVRKLWTRQMWILPPIMVGVAAILLAPQIKRGPQMEAVAESAVKVRAMKVSKLAVVPRVVGYGTVSPARSWQAVAEVAGQVAWISEDLKSGHTVPVGTELLRIEEANYRLVLAQVEAQLKALEVKSRTTRASLAIAEQEQQLLRDDQDRNRSLAENDLVSRTTVEASERQLLSGEARVQDLKNALDLNEAERQVLIATKEVAELDLNRTRIVAPFEIRIVDVNVGAIEYVATGQLLFTADGLEIAEVEASISIGRLRPLIRSVAQRDTVVSGKGVMGLSALVRLRTPTHSIEWPARVTRVAGAIDQQTQSLTVVVAVDRPVDVAEPGKRPPLFRNTFVEVELTARPKDEHIVVPISTLHQGRIYVVNDDDRLEVRPVEVNFTQGNFAVLERGIKPGERIVTSDLTSAVSGMLLDPQEDQKSKRRLVAEVTGKEPQR
jgi:RND family efflux transporter MFP subunit